MYKELTLYLYTYLMAESQKGYGQILGDSRFEFSIDGLASYSQLKRLISLTESLAKKAGADTAGPTQEEKEEVKLLEDKNKLTSKSIDLEEEQYKSSQELDKKFRDLSKTTEFFKGNLASAGYGVTTRLSLLTTGVGSLLGALSGYADQLQLGLQRGISGGIMDFAIAAKTGGVSLASFSKALEESGGGFASLGEGATAGAKNFGNLIGSVRTATASVGNLGLSNEQLAMFTAQQTKVAVAQGYKGKAAFEVVTNNSRALAKELDTLANQTGKSVLEMAQAAVKLAQDPLVSSFVRDIKVGGADVAKSLNSYAANFSALFGKEGDKLARDTLGPALAGLPMIINDTGKNMALASQSTYNEMNRLAQKAKSGEQMTDEDRQRLSDTIKREMDVRGGEIRMMSELGGPLGDSAKQFLALADQVEFYNSAAGAQRRKEDEAAQQFNTAMNQFKANLLALSIPFLKLINGIPWDYFIKTLNIFVDVLSFILRPLSELGKILSFDFARGLLPFTASIGTVVSAVIAVVSGFTVLKTGVTLFQDALRNIAGTTINLNALLLKLQAIMAKGLLSPGGTSKGGLGGIFGTDGGKDSKPGAPTSANTKGKVSTPAVNTPAVNTPTVSTILDQYGKPFASPASAPTTPTTPTTPTSLTAGSMADWKNGPTASSTMGGKFGKLMGSLNNSRPAGFAGKIGGNPLSWLAAAGLGYGADKLKEAGNPMYAGSAMSVGAGTLSGAATGAALGSIIPGLGTAAGAIIGGALGAVTSAISEWDASASADGLADADADAVSESNRYQSQSLDEQKAMARELRQLREDIGYGNAISARHVSVQETGNRQLSNLQLTQ